MNRASISIIGGGPAGCSAGLFLAKHGFDKVTIYEKSPNKRKTCGGLLTRRTIKKYGKYIDSTLLNPIKEGLLDFDGKVWKFSFKKPILYVIDRLKFDNNLRSIAESEGVNLVSKNTNSNLLKSNIVINAKGFSGSNHPALAISSICKLKNPSFSIIFRRKINPLSYFWIFPISENIANIGFGGVINKSQFPISNLFDHFIKKNNAHIIEKSIAPICLDGIIKKLGYHSENKTVLYVGESAGLVNPIIGAGIYCALISGEIAAYSLLKNDPLKTYVRSIYSEFHTEFLLSGVMRKILISVPVFIEKNIFKFGVRMYNSFMGL